MQPVASSTNMAVATPRKGGAAAGAQLPAPPPPPAAPSRPSGEETTAKAPSPEQIKQAIEIANKALQAIASNLEFEQDSSTGKTVMRIVDTTTQQVIRQYPTEEMLAIAHGLDRMRGLLLEDKA